MKNHLIAFWLFYVGFAADSWVLGCGLNCHFLVADRAITKVSDPELKRLLTGQLTAVLTGAAFPDVGIYIKSFTGFFEQKGEQLQDTLKRFEQKFGAVQNWMFAPFAAKANLTVGEFQQRLHWAPFYMDFMTELQTNKVCEWPISQNCAFPLMFLFGVIAHGVTDTHFDTFYVTQVAQEDFNGDIFAAQNYTDIKMDMIISAHKSFPWHGIAIPRQQVEKLIPEMSYDKIFAANVAMRSVVAASPVGYVFNRFLFSQEAEWGCCHWEEAKGGLEDSAVVVAKAWDMLWKQIRSQKFAKLPQISNEGHWPAKYFLIDGVNVHL